MFRLISIFLLATVAAFPQLEQGAPAEVDESLRETVGQFYRFFQQGRFREAEDLVDSESKDLYYDARKERILSFEIRQVDFDDEFRSADVLVAASWVLPMLGREPVPVPLASKWRLIDGVWRLHLEPRPKTGEGAHISPAGPMTFSDKEAVQLGTPAAMMNTPRPTLDSLANMYDVSGPTKLLFQRRNDSVQSGELLVANKAQGSLSVEMASQTTGLQVEISPEKIEPGEEAKITIAFDPKQGSPTDQQILTFQVMPIAQRFDVLVNFR